MGWYFRALGKRRLAELLLLIVFFLFFLGPLLNLVILAFSGVWRYPAILPQAWSLQWWTFVLSKDEVVKSIILSFSLAIVVTLCSIVVCVPAAYAFARMKFPFRNFFLFSFLLTHAFPKMGLYVSIAVLYYKVGLMNTFVGVVLMHLVNTLLFMTWIPSAAFRSIHRAQEEAARDVGASPLRVFWHVTLPMALPAITVASVFAFLASLNEAQGTFLVGIPDFKTMPLIMYAIVSDYPATAGAVFSMVLSLPTILLLFAVRRFVNADVISSGFQAK